MSFKPKVKVVDSDDFRQIYSMGAMLAHNPVIFSITFYSDRIVLTEMDRPPSEIKRVLETEIQLSPITAKQLYMALGKNISEFEKKFGEIKIGKAPDKKPPTTTYTT
ncbi:MAG: DUF3467 domain-containing protein [Candidatus Hodarchaeota archaeon]